MKSPETTEASGFSLKKPDLAPHPPGRRSPGKSYLFFSAIFILTAAVLVSGWLSIRRYALNFENEIGEQLTAIAELKAAEIVQWRKERLLDASYLEANASLAGLVRQTLQEPSKAEAARQLENLLARFLSGGQYDRIRLLDLEGTSLLSVPPGLPPVRADVSRRLSDVVRSGRTEIVDFQLDAGQGLAFLSLLVPVKDDRAPDQVLAVFALRIDPSVYLYPFITRWPVPTETAETLIVRREGDSVLFLNELRFKKDAALNLRVPLSRPTIAGLAAEGRKGLVKGLDYRGEEAIGYALKIPDSPWFLIARIDQKEAFAPVRKMFLTVLFFVITICFGLLVGSYALLLRNSIRVQRERTEAARNFHMLSSRQEALLAALPEIIMEVDRNHIYVWANQPGLDFFGDDVIGREAADYFVGDQDTYQTVKPVFEDSEDLVYVESRQRRKDGQSRLLAWWCLTLKDQEGRVSGALSSARDITEQRQAEETRRESEARYRTLVDNAPLPIMVNRENKIVLANTACLRLFGADSPDQILGKSPFELFHPDDHAVMRERINQLFDGGKAIPALEEKIVRLDGRPVDVEVCAVPFMDHGVQAGHVVLTDITGRKEAENRMKAALDALRSSEERFRKAFTTSPDAININRMSDGLFISINRGFTQMMEFTEEDVRGKTSREIGIWTDSNDRKRLVDSLKKDGFVENMEARFQSKNGRVGVGLMSASIVEIDGAPHIISITREITERIRSETALRSSEAKFRNIFENIQDVYYETAPDGVILEISPSIGLLSKGLYTREDLLGKSILDFYADPEERSVFLVRLAEQGRLADYEITLHNRDGSLIPCSLSCRIFTDALGRPEKIVGSIRDITERKRAELQIKDAIEALRVSLREKELLLQEIHHRIKNNLQIISSLFSLEAEHAEEETRRILKRGQTRIRSLSLVHEKLYRAADLSRIDLPGYIQSLVTHLFHVYLIDSTQVRLETDFEEVSLDINSAIPCGLILNELISNALKHAYPEGRKGVLRIRLARSPGGSVELEVSDDGVGLPDSFDIQNPEGFGFQIINLLVGQLEAGLSLDRKDGTTFTLKFKELKYKPRI